MPLVDRLGDEARETAREVDRLGDELARSGGGVTGFTSATDGASRGSQFFTRVLGGAGRVLAELGVVSAAGVVGAVILFPYVKVYQAGYI